MIQKISYRNFKSLGHVELSLERFTVIVGPNASGKTSLLEGLHYLVQSCSVDAQEWFRGPRDPLLLGKRGAKEPMVLECASNNTAVRLKVDLLGFLPENVLHPEPSSGPRWKFSLTSQDLTATRSDRGWKAIKEKDGIAEEFSSSALLRLDASRLAAPSYSERPRPRIEDDGEGLATVLAFIALNQPDSFQVLQEQLRKVIPALKRVRFDRVSISRYENARYPVTVNSERLSTVQRELVGDALVFDFQGAPEIPAHLVSEGTMLVLGLLTVLHGPKRPHLILLDDLGHGLHPKAQKEVILLIRRILAEDANLQVVATTHSPYLLDNVKPEEVRLTTLREDGSTACASLKEHPNFEKWKEEMSPGELWSLFGENWAVGS